MKLAVVIAFYSMTLTCAYAFAFMSSAPRSIALQKSAARIPFAPLYSEPADDEEGLDLNLEEMFEM